MTDEEFFARRNEFLIPGVVPKTLHEWLDWSSVNELRAEYPDLDFGDFEELKVCDEFLYRFPHAPRHMRRITPTPPSSANALNLETGGKHILVRWENHAVPVVRLKAGEPLDPVLMVPRPVAAASEK